MIRTTASFAKAFHACSACLDAIDRSPHTRSGQRHSAYLGHLQRRRDTSAALGCRSRHRGFE